MAMTSLVKILVVVFPEYEPRAGFFGCIRYSCLLAVIAMTGLLGGLKRVTVMCFFFLLC